MLRVQLYGFQEAQVRLEKARRKAEPELCKGLEQAAELVKTQAKRNASRGRPGLRVGTGKLRQSMVTVADIGALRYRVGSPLVYAPVHEFGATIRAKNRPYLVFWIPSEAMNPKKGLGHWVRVKQVTIPKRPYLGPALTKMRPQIQQRLEAALKRVLKG